MSSRTQRARCEAALRLAPTSSSAPEESSGRKQGVGSSTKRSRRCRGVELHGLQLFVNTTSEHKLNAPRVFALQGGEVPVWERQSDRARVVAGSYEGVSSPLPLDEPFTLLDVSLHTRLSYPLHEGQNNVIYVLDGDLEVGGVTERRSLHRGQAVAVSGRGDTVVLEAPAFSHFLVLSGTAVDEPIVEEGPFIMNSRAQVEAAIARYRSGEMGTLSPST